MWWGTWQMEARGAQRCPWLHFKFKASLGYVRLSFKKRKKGEKARRGKGRKGRRGERRGKKGRKKKGRRRKLREGKGRCLGPERKEKRDPGTRGLGTSLGSLSLALICHSPVPLGCLLQFSNQPLEGNSRDTSPGVGGQ